MDIKVPEVGESVFEAEVGKWHKQDGDRVHRDDLLCELETDKISLELNAAAAGVLRIKVREGETVEVGAVIGEIEEGSPGTRDQGAEGDQGEDAPEQKEKKKSPQEKVSGTAEVKKGAASAPKSGKDRTKDEAPRKEEQAEGSQDQEKTRSRLEPAPPKRKDDERTTRERMSPLRRKIAERLLAARQQTAMLTTFNEADLSRVLALRQKHGDDFEKKHAVPLGFMSFFVKAAVEALREFPEVNARIDGEDILYQHFYDIGIAIGGEKGLVVPVLRDADLLPFARIEQGIREFVDRIRENRLNLSDLEGGTFTISNGGVYGSLLSTPILNPPQSAVLGMHAIQQRPVVRDEQITARPMMYLALSYDHRIIDGRQAVTFLKRIKELVEEPEEMLLEL